MVDQQLLKRKINQIEKSLKMIEKYKDISYDNFINNEIVQSVVEYQLFTIINQMADIANHIVIDNGYGSVETMSDGFRILQKKEFIIEKHMDCYIKMVGFRNIIAHQYIDISKVIVYDILKNKLNDIKRFLLTIDENFI